MLTTEEKLTRLAKALEYGGNTHTVDDVVARIKEGKAQWWDNGDGMIVTEIHDFPRFKAGHYWILAGCLRDVLALEHDVNPWLIEQGCSVATASGRKGWGKVAAPTGWKPQPNMFNFYKTLVRRS